MNRTRQINSTTQRSLLLCAVLLCVFLSGVTTASYVISDSTVMRPFADGEKDLDQSEPHSILLQSVPVAALMLTAVKPVSPNAIYSNRGYSTHSPRAPPLSLIIV